MNQKKFINTIRIIIGHATKNGATEEEINIMCKAIPIFIKYWPKPETMKKEHENIGDYLNKKFKIDEKIDEKITKQLNELE